MKKTKIVATIGPASANKEVLTKIISEGVDVVRLNFSHGTHEEKGAQIKLVREVAHTLNKPVAIVADLCGPKLRLGILDEELLVNKGEVLTFSVDPGADEVPLQFDLSPYLKAGERVFINDGLLEFEVHKVKGKKITLLAKNSGVMSSKKGVNIPDTTIGRDAFTKKDAEDAVFALKAGVDFLALSFVQSAQDLVAPRKLILKHHPVAKIISKIEKPQAVLDLSAIIAASDAVMVARGDLAVETSAEEVPIIQQKIIRLGRQMQKPVIVATQMLESMTVNPRPTRAEASDVAHAVLSQVDAVMLSAESASGKYPIEAVATMRQIIERIEKNPEFQRYIKLNWQEFTNEQIPLNAIVSSAASLSYRMSSPVIAVGTVTGRTAGQLSSFRPQSFILAVAHDPVICRQLSLSWGVIPALLKPTKHVQHFAKNMKQLLVEGKFGLPGQKAVLVWGSTIGVTGTTDSIRIVTL